MKTFLRKSLIIFSFSFAMLFGSFAWAAEVTIGYQGIMNPWKVAIKDGVFEKRTGYKIKWRKFDSGSAVINAMASGDVHVAVAGSSPIAAGVARGLPIQLFWVIEDIASAEALVVRDGSGILSPQDLKGKRIGVPFVSTTHFHMLFALEQFGLKSKDVSLRNLQPPQISAAWKRGDIDAAFVWDPALGEIKKNGKVLITSGQLSSWGKATFDGMVVSKKFASANDKFMVNFVRVLDEYAADYRNNPGSWGAKSDKARKVADLAGGDASQVPGVLALYSFPSAAEQASAAWLGGGEDGGGARALRFTAEFLKKEKKVDNLPSSFAGFVNSKFAAEAAK